MYLYFKIFFYSALILIFISCKSGDDGISPDNNVRGENVPGLESDNPKIAEIVDKVSLDSLENYVNVLQEFFTRHTNSDTMYDTRGIGAARRWIYSKFLASKEKSAENITVYYDDFEQQILGLSRLHRNVLYRQEGSAFPGRIFIVGAHYDSRTVDRDDFESYAPGANDDGSGVAAVLELARILSGHTFKSTIILACFTGEEQGLYGSRHLAGRYNELGYNVEGMIGVDMIGNTVGGSGVLSDNTVRCFSQGPNDSKHRQLARFYKLQGEAYLEDFTINLIEAIDRPGRGGDHMAFVENDFTAIRITDPEDNMAHQHNPYDTMEYMDMEYLKKNVTIIAAVMAGLADSPLQISVDTVEEIGEQSVKVSWEVPSENEIKEFLIALRRSTHTFYDTLISAGLTSDYTLDKSENTIYVSLSAVDKENNESIFSPELIINKH